VKLGNITALGISPSFPLSTHSYKANSV